MSLPSSWNRASLTLTAACTISGAAFSLFSLTYLYRIKRSRWQTVEERNFPPEEIHSMIVHFKSLTLDPDTSVGEANKRRTVSYYEKARQAHSQSLVMGVGSYSLLVKLRRVEMDRILSYWNEGGKSHRTVIVMCDSVTGGFLGEARRKILAPLRHSADPLFPGCWIPNISMIPEEDMHVSVATPWWWHTIRENNRELSEELAARFRQTLLLKFHHPFQIELERIILLGGKTLVALWRCVGGRTAEDGTVIYDRHGESVDPFVRLREEIVRCFTTESPDSRRKPLTYVDKISNGKFLPGCLPPKPQMALTRQNTIESKTPGIGGGDGFIHTTLCRIPLDCMSMHDIELDKVHRLCREATATLSGHRMVISNFRFLETTGRGGESNPCIDPIYDETIQAPTPMKVNIEGTVTQIKDPEKPNVVRNQTIGAIRNLTRPNTIVGFFDNQNDQKSGDLDEADDKNDAAVPVGDSFRT